MSTRELPVPPAAGPRPGGPAVTGARMVLAGLLALTLLYSSDLALTSFAPLPLDLAVPPDARPRAVAPSAYVPVPPVGQGVTAASDVGTPVLPATPSPAPTDNDLSRRVSAIRKRLGNVVPGVLWQGELAVPVRSLLPLLKGEMQWDGSGVALVYWPGGRLSLRPGHAEVERNFTPVSLPAAPFARGDDVLVPVRSAGAAWGMELRTDGRTGGQTIALGDQVLRVLPGEQAFRIEIDRSDRWLRVSYAGELARQYPACIGEGDNTPTGEFHIQNKACWAGWRAYWGEYIPGGSPRNPLGARWLGTTARGRATSRVIGIHGTNQPSSIGTRISGGCVRLHNHHAIELYDVIPVGTRVTIHE